MCTELQCTNARPEPWWQSSNTRLSPLRSGFGSPPDLKWEGGSCLLLVGSFQSATLTNCMYWFPLPSQLPVVI